MSYQIIMPYHIINPFEEKIFKNLPSNEDRFDLTSMGFFLMKGLITNQSSKCVCFFDSEAKASIFHRVIKNIIPQYFPDLANINIYFIKPHFLRFQQILTSFNNTDSKCILISSNFNFNNLLPWINCDATFIASTKYDFQMINMILKYHITLKKKSRCFIWNDKPIKEILLPLVIIQNEDPEQDLSSKIKIIHCDYGIEDDNNIFNLERKARKQAKMIINQLEDTYDSLEELLYSRTIDIIARCETRASNHLNKMPRKYHDYSEDSCIIQEINDYDFLQFASLKKDC